MSGRLSEMIFDDPPGSFGAMSEWDKMMLEQDLRQSAERRRDQEQKAAESVISKTVEFEGENDG